MRLSAGAARALMLAAQGLLRPARRRAAKADVLVAIRRMGALQIDTIHVVARSPYLVLWSRLGGYEPGWLDALLAEGALFEYWSHEASFLPIEDYGLYRHRMIDPGSMGWKYSHDWIEANRGVVDAVLARIRAEGPVRSADFERTDGRKGSWWGWKAEKRALEMLFTAGELMVARRHNFQRVYDLRERVLPSWGDERLAPREEAERELALNAVHALGITTARWVADYFRMSRRETPAKVRALAAEGRLRAVTVGGWPEPAYVHPDRSELLESAAAGELRATRTTVLSPFDPLVWDRARASTVFGFDYRLECYTPAPKRRWGYFVLPILRRGALVGRADCKAHRREGRFEVKALYLEPGVRRSAALANDLARALVACGRWHGTPDVVVTECAPAAFAGELREALRTM